MQRYFLPEPYRSGKQFEVENEPFFHMVRVMRMKPGETVYLVFCDQVAIIAKISHISDTAVFLDEIEKEQQEKELPVAVTIAHGYPKADKLEWIVQKATELGAAGFIGFPAQSSVVKWDEKKRGKKQERLRKIAQEAAEQSQRRVCPTVKLLESSMQLTELFNSYDLILIAYEEAAKAGEQKQLVKALQEISPNSRVLAVFGPEGGFAPEEVAKFEKLGGKLCGLGPRILRTETAPLYLLSAVSYQLELVGM